MNYKRLQKQGNRAAEMLSKQFNKKVTCYTGFCSENHTFSMNGQDIITADWHFGDGADGRLWEITVSPNGLAPFTKRYHEFNLPRALRRTLGAYFKNGNHLS